VIQAPIKQWEYGIYHSKKAVLMEFRIAVCANNIIMIKIKSKGAKLNW
jgi:hypothetical protein